MTRIRRLLALLVAALSLLAVLATPAFASNSDGPSSLRSFDLIFNSWPVLLAAGTGFLSSQLTAVLTHEKAPQWVKSLTNLVFTSLGAAIITVEVVPGHTWKDYLGLILAGTFSSLATHYIGLTALAQSKTATFGFGGNTAPLVAPSGTTVTTVGPVAPNDPGDGGAY